MCFAVIMAGGRGERLRPLSTKERPKQFLRLFGDRTMIQETMDRIATLVPAENTYIVVGSEHVKLVQEQLPTLPQKNIIVEPMGRGTAPCIGLAALALSRINSKGVMIVLPADHVVKQTKRFLGLLADAVVLAREGTYLITLGIPPNRPATGYGYIKASTSWSSHSSVVKSVVLQVDQFVEKPDRETAERFLCQEDYYWNSGIFVWRVDTILHAIKQHMPNLYKGLMAIEECTGTSSYEEILNRIYGEQETVSIDYGVMEKCDQVLVLPTGDIGWSDVGNWEALREVLKKVEKPWGFEELWALNSNYAGKILHIRAGESLSVQYHKVKEETILLQSGRLLLHVGKDTSALQNINMLPGMSFHIPPGLIHQMEAIEECVLLEVSTPHLDDVVCLKDSYGRV